MAEYKEQWMKELALSEAAIAAAEKRAIQKEAILEEGATPLASVTKPELDTDRYGKMMELGKSYYNEEEVPEKEDLVVTSDGRIIDNKTGNEVVDDRNTAGKTGPEGNALLKPKHTNIADQQQQDIHDADGFLEKIGAKGEYDYGLLEEQDGWLSALTTVGLTGLSAYIAKEHGASDKQVGIMLASSMETGGKNLKKTQERIGRQKNIDVLEAKGYLPEDITKWLDTGETKDLTQTLRTRPFANDKSTKITYRKKGDKLPDGSIASKDGSYETFYTFNMAGVPEVSRVEYNGNLEGMKMSNDLKMQEVRSLGRGGVGRGGVVEDPLKQKQAQKETDRADRSLTELDEIITSVKEGDVGGYFDAGVGWVQRKTGYGGEDARGRTQAKIEKVKKEQIAMLKPYFGPQVSDSDIAMMLGYDNIDVTDSDEVLLQGLNQVRKRYLDLLEDKRLLSDNGSKPVNGVPQQGDTVDGYMFKGGNPNEESNWVPLQ